MDLALTTILAPCFLVTFACFRQRSAPPCGRGRLIALTQLVVISKGRQIVEILGAPIRPAAARRADRASRCRFRKDGCDLPASQGACRFPRFDCSLCGDRNKSTGCNVRRLVSAVPKNTCGDAATLATGLAASCPRVMVFHLGQQPLVHAETMPQRRAGKCRLDRQADGGNREVANSSSGSMPATTGSNSTY